MNNEDKDGELSNAIDVVMKRIATTSAHQQSSSPPRGHLANDFGNPERDDVIPSAFKQHWYSIVRHLWLVIGITLLATTIAIVYAIRKPDVFQSEGRVQVNVENNSALSGSKNTPVILNNDSGSDPTYFNTQIQILGSPALLRRVVRTLDLEHNQGFVLAQQDQSSSSWENIKRVLHIGGSPKPQPTNIDVLPLRSSATSSTAADDVVEATRLAPYVDTLKKFLKIERVVDEHAPPEARETRLIDLKFEYKDPVLAAKIVNVLCDAFVLANLEKRTEANASAGEFLLRRISQLQAQIRTDEERLINYAKNNQILTLDANQNTVVDRLAGLNRQLLAAEDERKQAEAAYRAAMAPGAADALTSSEFKTAEDRLSELRQRRAQLLVENTEEWPEVKEIDQQIVDLEKQISAKRSSASANLLAVLETRYRQALTREQSLASSFEQQRKQTLTQNEAAINYRIIQQEIETNKSLLDGLLQRSKENDMLLAGTPNNVRVVDYAVVPTKPIGPNRLWIVSVAFFVNLIAAVGLALGLEYLNDTIRSTGDVERLLHLPALTIIPTINGTGHRSRDLSNNNHPELLIDPKTSAILVEAYRQLRTSVLLSSLGPTTRTILVSSSLPVEGKTTTAINFAFSLAQTGAKVLLVDADLRRPRIHSVFGVENKHGLSEILSNDLAEKEIMEAVVAHTQSGLFIVTSGSTPAKPTELIGSDQMRRFIKTMQGSFTHIVFDSPPIAPCTDSVVLSSMVDGVLLVVHGGKTSQRIVRRSQQVIQDVGGHIFGVVLNNTNVAADDDYYYSHRYTEYYSSETRLSDGSN